MNDHDHDAEPNPLHELASAYLDGDVDAAEHARVESSPELQALVQSFRRVRDGLGDVPAAPVAARDAAFAAAFAEFDAAFATPTSATPVATRPPAPTVAPVIPLSSRRRWAGPLLSAAAAVVLLGVVGAAIINGRGDDSKSSSATEAPADIEMSSAADSAQSEAADTMSPASTIGAIPAGGAQAATVIDTPEQLQALALPAQEGAPAFSETTMPAAGGSTAPGAAPDDTSAVADTAFKVASAPSRPALGCLTEQQVFLADIQLNFGEHRGAFAIAVRDTVTDVTQAIADDCTVLATVGG
ncbi:MAG: hypothetical protein WCC60_05905 [Ilumatobacteraceae bacterium]